MKVCSIRPTFGQNFNYSNPKNIQNVFQRAQYDSVSFSSKKISLPEAIKEFEKINVKATAKKDGTLVLDDYEPHPKDHINLTHSEDELFEVVSEIKGYANFGNSNLTSTKALEKIGKNAVFSHSKIREIPNLRYIGKDAYFENSKIQNFDGLKVNRSLIIEIDKVTKNVVEAVCGDELNIAAWSEGLVRIYNQNYKN